jgi:hypothetical protein
MGMYAELHKLQREALEPQGVVAITPSDTVNLTKSIRGFMIGTAGDVSVAMGDGSTAIMPSCAVGVEYMGKITRINATGTTATGIVGLI